MVTPQQRLGPIPESFCVWGLTMKEVVQTGFILSHTVWLDNRQIHQGFSRMEHGNQGRAQRTTEETNNSKEEQPSDHAVSSQEISPFPQIIGMRTPPGSMERESPSHGENKCPPFSLEVGLLETGPHSDIEIGSGDNMKGSSSQEPNLQLPVSNLKTHGLKEEPSNSKEEKISAQIVSHLEMSLFVPMKAIIGKVTSRGSVRVPPSPKCAPFPVNPGCSSGPQSDTEKGSGDTLQNTASFLDNTIKGKESKNIKEEKKTLKKSVILNVAPVTGMESKKKIKTCATQTEETFTLLVSHKAVQIPEESSKKAQDPRSELQSPDIFPSSSNISGLIEKEKEYKRRQEEKKQVKQEKKKFEKMEKNKEKENGKKQNEESVKKVREEKEEKAKNERVIEEKDMRRNEKHKKEKEEKEKKERMKEKKESLKKEKHKEEKEERKTAKGKGEKEEEYVENSEEEREDKRKEIEAERLALQKRLQLKGRMKGMKNSEVWWPKEKKLIGKIAIQNFIQLLPSSSTILKSPDIEDHVNRPKKRHMDLQEHLDQKFVGQKGKTNRKERKCKGRGNVSNSEEEDQAEKNKIKRIDKKQKLETVKVLRRRSIWFQKMTLGDLHPLYTPRPCRIYLLTLEGTHTETTTIINGDRQYGLDPEEREEVTLEERLMTQLVQKGKKTIQETLPKVKVRRSLKQQVKSFLLLKRRRGVCQHMIWEEDMGTVQAKKEKENKAIILTHNLVRFSSRTIVGAIKASNVTEWEQVAGTQDEKKGLQVSIKHTPESQCLQFTLRSQQPAIIWDPWSLKSHGQYGAFSIPGAHRHFCPCCCDHGMSMAPGSFLSWPKRSC
ncbi:protein split ends-like isoform X3 [Monodelphis domestica]|uniref:protein split ends-like isoform X3 n=1 Tax=Monodelphis domestica TaxID=13616 RepID=UPI0024E26E85|nr:protein split ends-like isoform X3 [Monodelphis domestica]